MNQLTTIEREILEIYSMPRESDLDKFNFKRRALEFTIKSDPLKRVSAWNYLESAGLAIYASGVVTDAGRRALIVERDL